jgi:hypothetical protein
MAAVGGLSFGRCHAMRTVNYNSAQRCTAQASSRNMVRPGRAVLSKQRSFTASPTPSTRVGRREGVDMSYPWYTKLIIGVAVVLLLSSPSASAWRFIGEWSPTNVALIAIGLMLTVIIDHTAQILEAVRDLNEPTEGR